MITHQEIKNLEIEWGIREDIIEKDYVIGWVLWGLGTDPYFSEKWIFKGGTCLKKCYIETWRFSEDLDFTVIPTDAALNVEEIEENLKKALDRISDESGIDFSVSPIKLKHTEDPFYLEVRIYYRGPRNARTPASIKFDLTSSEKLIVSSYFREINHPYSDKLPKPAKVKCYAIEEVYAEKIRAMGERSRPRDLYDIINLLRRTFQFEKPEDTKDILSMKCHSKDVSIPTFLLIKNSPYRVELEAEWENMLRHQLPELPPFDDFWSELPKLFDWLEGKYISKKLPSVSFRADEDKRWSVPPTIQKWGLNFPLEKIRYAAVNHICVELGYNNTKRLIEPYSLRRTKKHNLILHALRRSDGEHRSYRIDRIQSAEIANITFSPKYQIEFSSAGPLQIRPTLRQSIRSYNLGVRRKSPRKSSKSFSLAPKYIFECPICNRKFNRTRYNTNLRPHKNKSRWQCPGRIAIFVGRE